MTGILLPDWVEQNQVRASFFTKRSEWAEFDRALKDLDPDLSLVYADLRESPSPGIVPGYFHIRRKNQKGPDNYLPITGPKGEYIEPNSGVLENLRANDLWNRNVYKQKLDALAKEEEKQKNPQSEFAKHAREEAMIHVKANTNPGVLVSDTSWAPKAKARKKTKK